jgi:hypothetical protein
MLRYEFPLYPRYSFLSTVEHEQAEAWGMQYIAAHRSSSE